MNHDEDSPPPLPPPVPIEIGHSHHESQRSRRRRRGSSFVGKLWLVAFFCLFYSFDAYFYFNAPLEARAQQLGTAIASNLWLTALLIGIWRRQNWARILLIGFLFFLMILEIIALPVFLQSIRANLPTLKILGAQLALQVFVALVLTFSRDIRRLTNRHYE